MRREGRWRKRCPSTGRYRFHSAADAMVSGIKNPYPVTAYQCEDCGCWHTSSQWEPRGTVVHPSKRGWKK